MKSSFETYINDKSKDHEFFELLREYEMSLLNKVSAANVNNSSAADTVFILSSVFSYIYAS